MMRRVPAPVAVVTVDLDGERVGLTVGSLVSLSLDPPLLGFAVSRQAALHELLREAGVCAVSVLAASQEDVAAHFARGVPPIAHWHGVAVREREAGPPLIDGALGWIDCRVEAAHPVGGHTFFVAEALTAEAGPGRGALVRVDGRYAAL